METSRVLARPGLRTLARPGWRAGLGIALSIVAGQPRLWLLGMVGFCLRGGLLLLTLPIVVIPTQVEARLLIGNYLGSTGFSPSFWGVLALAATAAALVTMGVLLVLARVELSAFQTLIEDDATADGTGFQPIRPAGLARRQLFLRLLGVQVLTFLALIASAAPLVWAVAQKSFDEITRPASSAPIYERVLGGVGDQLFLFLVALVVIEMLSALTSRELLTRAVGWREPNASHRLWLLPALASAAIRTIRSPLRTVGTAAMAWVATAAVVIPALWAIGLAWSAVRGAFLTSVSFSDLGDNIGMVLVAFGLAAAFLVAICICGFSSALRAALWSVNRLR